MFILYIILFFIHCFYIFAVFFVFERCLLCPQRLHLFDPKKRKFNEFLNVIYSCDRKAEFSEAIAPVFSVHSSQMYTGFFCFSG